MLAYSTLIGEGEKSRHRRVICP
jgi:hypothetical protein